MINQNLDPSLDVLHHYGRLYHIMSKGVDDETEQGEMETNIGERKDSKGERESDEPTVH